MIKKSFTIFAFVVGICNVNAQSQADSHKSLDFKSEVSKRNIPPHIRAAIATEQPDHIGPNWHAGDHPRNPQNASSENKSILTSTPGVKSSTAVSTCGTTITTPDTYILQNDVTAAGPYLPCITISVGKTLTSTVLFDCNYHTITVPGVDGFFVDHSGTVEANGSAYVEIQHCTIVNTSTSTLASAVESYYSSTYFHDNYTYNSQLTASDDFQTFFINNVVYAGQSILYRSPYSWITQNLFDSRSGPTQFRTSSVVNIPSSNYAVASFNAVQGDHQYLDDAYLIGDFNAFSNRTLSTLTGVIVYYNQGFDAWDALVECVQGVTDSYFVGNSGTNIPLLFGWWFDQNSPHIFTTNGIYDNKSYGTATDTTTRTIFQIGLPFGTQAPTLFTNNTIHDNIVYSSANSPEGQSNIDLFTGSTVTGTTFYNNKFNGGITFLWTTSGFTDGGGNYCDPSLSSPYPGPIVCNWPQ